MDLHTLWVGARLGWLERVCVTSMLAHGHRVVLWSYGPVENVPDGVLFAPAERVLPKSAIIRHRSTQSLALFSNRFRYRLLRMHAVTWVDIDLIFLRPLTDEGAILFGREDPTSVCNAVLRLPPDHTVLAEIENLALQRVPVLFWMPWHKRWHQRLAGLVGRHMRPEDMTWGTFGPRALTESLRRHKLLHLARSSDVFYPIHWSKSHLIFEAAAEVERAITSETIAVHLWGDSNQRERRKQPPQAGSWIGSMCERFAVTPENELNASSHHFSHLNACFRYGS